MQLVGLVFVLVSNLFALLAPDAYGQASQPKPSARIPTVGVLYPGVPDLAISGRRFSAVFALQEGLHELGYVDGQNIVLMYRWAGGKSEKLPDLAADLVRLKVDVLFAVGSQTITAAMAASRTIPIVATDLESDPVEGGYVASFARPGGNVTGLFLDLPELTGKWLQLVREVSPQAAAKAATIELRILEVRRPAEYGDALLAAMSGRAQALVQLSSPLIRQASRQVAEFTVKNRLLAISMFREFPEGGGLMAYGPDLLFLRRAAVYVDKILKGAKPGDLAVEQPTKYELVVNLQTAKVLGLAIPQPLLLRADQVIQ
jgi:putative ABC transport system substrate-binding protein